MPRDKQRRIAWITGASSGIGRALALKMAAENWDIAATARSLEKLETLARESISFPGSIYPFASDITDTTKIKVTLDRIESECGMIDLAVLNAGTHISDDAANLTGERISALLQLNVIGTVQCLHAVLDKMRGRGVGHIAVVSSLAGYGGLPGATAYGGSKAALINLTESLQPELAKAGIKLQLVSPGFVRTPLTDKNDFEMPFLMEVDRAVDAFYNGLMSNRFEITFPRRFALLMKLLRLMPYGLYFRITRRLLRN